VATSKTETSAAGIVIRGELRAYDGDTEVFSRVWERKVRRDLVWAACIAGRSSGRLQCGDV
jgi:hypothetical protein